MCFTKKVYADILLSIKPLFCVLFFKLKDDNIGEKKVPQLRGVSISDNAPAFQRSVNNLATLAYATEGNLLRGIVIKTIRKIKLS